MNIARGAVHAPRLANQLEPRRVGIGNDPVARAQARRVVGLFPGQTTVNELHTAELERALVDGRIDMAIRSLRDVEPAIPRDVVLGCLLRRDDAREALVVSDRIGPADPDRPLEALPPGAVVGLSSVCQQAQLRHARPDIRIAAVPGGADAILATVRDGACDAAILGQSELNWLNIIIPRAVVLPPEIMLPRACQGVVGIFVRADSHGLRTMLEPLDDRDTRLVVTAERSLLTELDGSAGVAIGAYARILSDGQVLLSGMVGRADGSFLITRNLVGRQVDAERMGQTLGTGLRANSPEDIFD